MIKVESITRPRLYCSFCSCRRRFSLSTPTTKVRIDGQPRKALSTRVSWLARWMDGHPPFGASEIYMPIAGECLNGHMKCMSSFVMSIDTLCSRRYKYPQQLLPNRNKNAVGWSVWPSPKKESSFAFALGYDMTGVLNKKNSRNAFPFVYIFFFFFYSFPFFSCVFCVSGLLWRSKLLLERSEM